MCALLAAVACLFSASCAGAARIKDIAFVEGTSPNQPVGYGLVVGLSGTGDKTSAAYTTQSISNMLNRLGVKLDPKAVRVKNTAAVLVTAELPPYIKPGSRIDVVVSSLGDSTSLQGGTLISTPLKGADGAVYAVAQGPLSLAGFSAGSEKASVSKNHQTAGKLPGGALIEKEVPMSLLGTESFFLYLSSPDFTTAERMVRCINSSVDGAPAHALDPGRVRVEVPEGYRDDMVAYISKIEALSLNPDAVTKVVVNERTGTVVMGENVKISEVAISHGDITVEIKTQYLISQPSPLSSKGETVVQPIESTKVTEEQSHLVVLPESASLGDVVRALNLVGVTPRDLVAILEAIKAAGALHAELEII